jgi:tetratricopeptide (TPR) repeat protein
MKYLLILFTAVTLRATAQTALIANKKYVESVNHWTALYTGKDNVYNLGYIYIDPAVGLAVHREGSFTIVGNNYVPTKLPLGSLNPIPLKDEPTKVAWVPQNRFKELQIVADPEWLHTKKMDTTSAAYLLKWAFTYNSSHEPQKALYYLDRVKKINPNTPGIDFEYAYAYNALHQFDKSEAILRKSLAARPTDQRVYKELIYEEVFSDKMDKAEQNYKLALPYSTTEQKADLAYNICRIYYQKKNKPKFDIWAAEAKKWVDPVSKQMDGLNKMIATASF